MWRAYLFRLSPHTCGNDVHAVTCDDYITDAKTSSMIFTTCKKALGSLAVVYVMGIAASYAYNRIMVNIGQGTLRNIRDDLFLNMETLPIKYFDTHPHGDIMSVYTNDVDTLRQFISPEHTSAYKLSYCAVSPSFP